jgi:hypothetical protein
MDLPLVGDKQPARSEERRGTNFVSPHGSTKFIATPGAIEATAPQIEVISLWQPWATWILWGWKTIETRLHPRFWKLEGQRIGIHAAQKFDRDWHLAAARYLHQEQFVKTREFNHVSGALLCAVHVERHRPCSARDSQSALIDCSPTAYRSRFGLILRPDILKFDPPIPMRGHQGIFKADIPA